MLQPIKEKHVMRIACAKKPDGIHDKLAQAFPELTITVLNGSFMKVESGRPVNVGPLVRFLEDNGAEVAEARRMQPSLEDIFVDITGIEADAMHKEKEKKGGAL